MKEWHVYYFIPLGEEFWNGESHLIILPSFWKVILWFLRTARRCSFISIRVVMPEDYETIEN